jgi:hypothetical protein
LIFRESDPNDYAVLAELVALIPTKSSFFGNRNVTARRGFSAATMLFLFTPESPDCLVLLESVRSWGCGETATRSKATAGLRSSYGTSCRFHRDEVLLQALGRFVNEPDIVESRSGAAATEAAPFPDPAPQTGHAGLPASGFGQAANPVAHGNRRGYLRLGIQGSLLGPNAFLECGNIPILKQPDLPIS